MFDYKYKNQFYFLLCRFREKTSKFCCCEDLFPVFTFSNSIIRIFKVFLQFFLVYFFLGNLLALFHLKNSLQISNFGILSRERLELLKIYFAIRQFPILNVHVDLINAMNAIKKKSIFQR